MTAHRRPLLLLASAASSLFLPACLFIGGGGTPVAPPPDPSARGDAEPEHRPVFAELRPGKTLPKDAMVQKDGKDGKDARDTTALRPAPAKNPEPPGPPGPPPSPGVETAAAPPGPFKLPTLQPAAPTEPPLLAAIREYAAGRADRAIEILKALDPPNQEFVLAMLPALARGATGDLADPTVAAVLAEQLRGAEQRLEPRAALIAENVTFCKKVYGFGRYDLWPEGQPHRPNEEARLYLEVRNLPSRPAAGPLGETHLTHVRVAVEVRDAHGRPVEQPDYEDGRRRVQVVRFEKKLYSRGPVHDFHVLYGFQVPATPGVYTVTVELRDPVGRRSVKTAPVEFRVAGP